MATERYTLRDGSWATIDTTEARSPEVSLVLDAMTTQLRTSGLRTEPDVKAVKDTTVPSRAVLSIRSGDMNDSYNVPSENQYGGRELAMHNAELFLLRLLVTLLTQRDYPSLVGLESPSKISDSDIAALQTAITTCEQSRTY